MGKTKKLRLNRFDCVACGTSIGVDEDACCASCGRQTVIVKRGVPDYSLVLAGMEAEEDLASRASPSAPPEAACVHGVALCMECAADDYENPPPSPSAPSVPREVVPLVEAARRMTAKLDRLQDALDHAPPVPGRPLLPRDQRESQEHRDLRAALRLLGGADAEVAVWLDSRTGEVIATKGNVTIDGGADGKEGT